MNQLDQALEQFGVPPLPEGASQIRYEADPGGADPAVWLRFQLPAPALTGLLKAWDLETAPDQGRVIRNYTASRFDWWQPDALEPQRGLRLELDAPRRHARHLLAGPDTQGQVTVYAFFVGL